MCFKHPIVISKRALLAPFHIPTDPSRVPEWHAYVAHRIYFSGKFIFGADFKNATRKAIWAPGYGGRSVDFVRGASPRVATGRAAFFSSGSLTGRPPPARPAPGLWGSRSRPCPREPSGGPRGPLGEEGAENHPRDLWPFTRYTYIIYAPVHLHIIFPENIRQRSPAGVGPAPGPTRHPAPPGQHRPTRHRRPATLPPPSDPRPTRHPTTTTTTTTTRPQPDLAARPQ